MGQLEDIDIWTSLQCGITAIFMAFFPFIVCLVLQIKHEMASNPSQFQLRKLLLVTALLCQLLTLTFLRDQYVWNEQIADEDESPNALLCGLSRALSFGVLETSTFGLLLLLIWDETEAVSVSRNQFDAQRVFDAKWAAEKRSFHGSNLFRAYAFAVSALLLLPSSLMPSSFHGYFLDGVGDYRCEMSTVANYVGLANKIIFLIALGVSMLQLRRTAVETHASNLLMLFVIVPLCAVAQIFFICDECWLHWLSLDDARKFGFFATSVSAMAMVCNHLMMQAQAKRHIVSATRRVSGMVISAGKAARNSIFNRGKIEIEPTKIDDDSEADEDSEPEIVVSGGDAPKGRFSVQEITEDEYEEQIIRVEAKKKLDNVAEHEEESAVEQVLEKVDELKETAEVSPRVSGPRKSVEAKLKELEQAQNDNDDNDDVDTETEENEDATDENPQIEALDPTAPIEPKPTIDSENQNEPIDDGDEKETLEQTPSVDCVKPSGQSESQNEKTVPPSEPKPIVVSTNESEQLKAESVENEETVSCDATEAAPSVEPTPEIISAKPSEEKECHDEEDAFLPTFEPAPPSGPAPEQKRPSRARLSAQTEAMTDLLEPKKAVDILDTAT